MFATCPYYALFTTVPARSSKYVPGELIFSFTDGDKSEGWDLLQQNLAALDQNQNAHAYIIRFYTDAGKSGVITPKTEHTGSFLFRMKQRQDLPALQGMGAVQPAGYDNNFMLYLREQLEEYKCRVQDLEAENDELVQQLLEAKKGSKGAKEFSITGILQQTFEARPDIMGTVLNRVLDVFMPPAPSRPYATAMNGVHDVNTPRQAPAQAEAEPAHDQDEPAVDMPPDQRVNAAIKKLVAFYVNQEPPGDQRTREMAGFTKFSHDMQALAGMTDNPQNFTFLLSYLRG